MPVILNDALGIAQFLAKVRGEQAVPYLLAIETLTLDNWKAAKSELQLSQGHTTKEGYINAIVTHFVNTSNVENHYVVGNLGILPGLQPSALELITYTAGTLHAVTRVANHIVVDQNKPLQ